MSIKKIYFISIFLVTLFIICLFILQENDHAKELNRIKELEEKYKKDQLILDEIRSKTKPCVLLNLNDPRSCYFNSNYKCKWNEMAKRCDSL